MGCSADLHRQAGDAAPGRYDGLRVVVFNGTLKRSPEPSNTDGMLAIVSSELNEAGQWAYYGKVGAALTTGNDDGGKHVSAQVLYALQHIGLAIPPQADTYWTGEAGPGPSYADPDAGGQHNAWATRNTVFMTWNVLHLARMLKDAGGIPTYGNSTFDWDVTKPGHPNPELP